MENRTAAVIITVVVVILCACPGLLFLCNGLLALIEVLSNYQVQIYGYNAPYILAGSLCIGILGILIAVLVSYFVLRQKRTSPPPTPPTPPAPPTSDEPLPPTI